MSLFRKRRKAGNILGENYPFLKRTFLVLFLGYLRKAVSAIRRILKFIEAPFGANIFKPGVKMQKIFCE